MSMQRTTQDQWAEHLPIPNGLLIDSHLMSREWNAFMEHNPLQLEEYIQQLTVSEYRELEQAVSKEIGRHEEIKKSLIAARQVLHQAVNGR